VQINVAAAKVNPSILWRVKCDATVVISMKCRGRPTVTAHAAGELDDRGKVSS
jgi:hypothetical protein